MKKLTSRLLPKRISTDTSYIPIGEQNKSLVCGILKRSGKQHLLCLDHGWFAPRHLQCRRQPYFPKLKSHPGMESTTADIAVAKRPFQPLRSWRADARRSRAIRWWCGRGRTRAPSGRTPRTSPPRPHSAVKTPDDLDQNQSNGREARIKQT